MPVLTAGRLLLAVLYAGAPFICFWGLMVDRRGARCTAEQLVLAAVTALAALVILGTTIGRADLDCYHVVHALLLVVTGSLLCWRLLRRRARDRGRSVRRGSGWLPLLLVLSLAVRLAPMIGGGPSLGAGDARFHNLLAHGIRLARSLPETWLPFAPIRVMYPLGSHLLAAFLADVAGCPVHHALAFLLAVTGALTTGMIFLVARQVLGTATAAAWAAACYSFLTLWGSLDYYRWGGLPNALGMLLVCLLLLVLVAGSRATGTGQLWLLIAGACCVVAILLVHHYSLLVAGLLLATALLLGSREIRLLAVAISLAGAVLGAPFLVADYLRFAGTVGATNVLVFREPVLYLWQGLLALGPGLVVLAGCGLVAVQRSQLLHHGRLLVLAWLTGLLVFFVAAEYLYRGAVLLATGGADGYTCLTPTRLLTDAVYPAAILAGLVTLTSLWQRHWRWLVAAMVLLAVATVAWTWQRQWSIGEQPEVVALGTWLREHSPADAMVVGVLPHLEYLSWRETVRPPLPASEERLHPAMAWKGRLRTVNDWLDWQDRSGRPVYIILRCDEARPAVLQEVLRTASYSLCRAPGGGR